MRLNDAISGVVLVVFAVAEISYTRSFPSLHGQSYGPDLFPRIIGIGLIICGLVLIVRGLTEKRRTAGSSVWFDFDALADNRSVQLNFALVLLSLVAYIFFSAFIGFIPMSLVIIAVLLYRLGSSALVSMVTAVLATLIIQLLFAKVLLVPLPAGLLRGIVW